MKNVKNIINFLFEVGILSKTPRSGFFFLGSGQQSVAEHTNRTVFIGYTLAKLEGDVDVGEVMTMCLFHDLPESRTSDLNYVHQKYAKAFPKMVLKDFAKTLPFGEDIKAIVEKYEKRKSKEAVVAKDADNLDWIMSMKEQADAGNTRAREWMFNSIKRLKTKSAVEIAEKMQKIDSQEWFIKSVVDTEKRKRKTPS